MASIKGLYGGRKPVFSCEIYPPKKEAEFTDINSKLQDLKDIGPDFISVTYGAGGSNAGKALEIASYAKNTCGLEVLSHITSVGFDRKRLEEGLLAFRKNNIENVLALRGDRPKTMTDEEFDRRDFIHASDMASFITKEYPDFTVAGACYPEKHFEAPDLESDADNLKIKADAGCSFFISQLFFDNDTFLKMLERIKKRKIDIPVSAGIMPITSAKMLGNTVTLSGTSVPKALSDIIAKYGDDPESMKEAGISYAVKQAENLLKEGVDGIHLYIMNKPWLAKQIFESIR
ncbi:MAG: methylenetetrahydrofolate reductase [Lachnospiraceae bacterium]|nr:methylenetetrahydrofolate reductase [Lachnospiraceae bacterium]